MTVIRKARMNDVPVIIRLWKEFNEEHDSMVLEGDQRLSPFVKKNRDAERNYESFVRSRMDSDDCLILLAFDGDEAQGFCISCIRKRNPPTKYLKYGYISELFVRPGSRGSGTASMLKDESIKWFRKMGLGIASIAVSVHNPQAHEIYRRWGFLDYHINMKMRI